MIRRAQLNFARERLFKGKALIIYGPRQVGKTTFSRQLLKEYGKETLQLNGDNYDTRELLSEPNPVKLKTILGKKKILFIDEAQRIPEIGLVIKIVIDQLNDIQVIATGSSSFDLLGKINEPLTGRKYELLLLPLSWQELSDDSDIVTEGRMLEQRLIYGAYPEIVTDTTKAQEHLLLIANSYLYKDLFELERIKKPLLFEKLVKALALQVGSEVNVNELSRLLSVDNKTIEKYIVLLEKSFVLFSLSSYSRNVRNELRKSRKIYFYDNGIINAVTGNFNALNNRNDTGSLWENYLISERKKVLNMVGIQATMHFWRTTQQQEIDYIEASFDVLKAFEFKWKKKQNAKFSRTFTNAYPEASTKIISKTNYLEFLNSSGLNIG
jgi:predicted AAA+ superfamily ATPase